MQKRSIIILGVRQEASSEAHKMKMKTYVSFHFNAFLANPV